MSKFLIKKREALLSSNWWADPSCLAAFRFRGAASEAEALKDWTGHGYDLAKNGSPAWNAANGFSFTSGSPYLQNASLNNQAIYTIVVRYASLSYSSSTGSTFFAKPGGSNDNAWLAAQLSYAYYWNGEWIDVNSSYPAWLTSFKGNAGSNSPLVYRRGNSRLPSGGVFGADRGGGMYVNGVARSSSQVSRAHENLSTQRLNHDRATLGRSGPGSFILLGAAFYSQALDALTHARINQNMRLF